MSNSSLVTYTKLSPNCTSPRNHAIDTVSIHCMAGKLTAKQCLNLSSFSTYSTTKGCSCNYAIGYDGEIALCVNEADRSWCTSSRSNDNRAITIEVSNSSNTDSDWPVSDAAYKSLINLLVDICQRNGIKRLLWQRDKDLIGQVSKQNMTVHRWFAAKACPGDYLYGRHAAIAAEVNKRLNAAADAAEEEDDDMDKDKFKALFLEMRQDLRDNDASDYSQEARDWATNSGLIKGGSETEFNGMWEDLMTREQLVTVLYRFAQLMGKA